MKVQIVNNNKAMILLTSKELAEKQITLNDIKEGKERARDFFFEILEEAQISEEFGMESSQLLIEVSYTNDDLFMITITKADCIPDVEIINKMKQAKNISYTVSSNLYEFNNLYNLYLFAHKTIEEDLFVGCNSLYELNNKYYLLFSNLTIKRASFVKTFSIITEYSSNYYSKKVLEFLEYSKPLIKNSALQTIQKI